MFSVQPWFRTDFNGFHIDRLKITVCSRTLNFSPCIHHCTGTGITDQLEVVLFLATVLQLPQRLYQIFRWQLNKPKVLRVSPLTCIWGSTVTVNNVEIPTTVVVYKTTRTLLPIRIHHGKILKIVAFFSFPLAICQCGDFFSQELGLIVTGVFLELSVIQRQCQCESWGQRVVLCTLYDNNNFEHCST